MNAKLSTRTSRRFDEWYQSTDTARQQRVKESRQHLKQLRNACPIDRTPEEHERVIRSNFPEYYEDSV